MRFDVLFHAVTCFLVLVGIVAVTLAEEAHVYLLLLGALIFCSWKRDVAGRAPLLSRTTSSLLSLAALLYLAADYYVLSADALRSLAHFLMLLQVIKLYAEKTHRDFVLLYVICLVQLGLASLLLFQLDFLALFAGYCLLGTWALVLFHIKTEYERCREQDPTFEPPPVGLRFALAGGALALLVGTGTVAVFAAIPRFGNGYLRYPALVARPVSGLGDEVDYSVRGEILESSQVVMRVKVEGPQRVGPLLFRGQALDRYVNQRWVASPPPVQQPGRLHPDFHNRFTLRSRAPARPLVQTYYLQPSTSRLLFYVQQPYELQVLTGLSNPILVRDFEGVLEGRGYRGKQIVYRVESRQPELLPRQETASRARMHGMLRHRRYTQLPPDFPRQRFRKLARQLNRRAGAKTDFQRVMAVRDHLQRSGGFQYTLKNQRRSDGEPLVEFLFDRKTGHCEYYAGAMAALLRVQGLACRMVTGYLGAEYNPVGQYYLVRSKHAHAWVEVWFAGAGWLPFDATPAGSETLAGGGLASRLGELLDYARLLWITRVVSYDFYDQQSLYRMARRSAGAVAGAVGLGRRRSGGTSAPQSDAPPRRTPALILLGGALLLVLLRRRWGGWLRRRRGPRDSPEARHVRALERILARHTLRRLPGETHQELAVRAEAAGLCGALDYVACYSGFRYRGRPPGAAELRRLRELLRDLRSRR